jgi:hypothetical protein
LQDENKPIEKDSREYGSDEQLFARLIIPLQQSRFWIQLFAGCLIFYGALLTVTGLGILVAWLPMWIGVLLFMASKSIRRAYNENDANALISTITRFKTVFTILGLASVMLISITLYLVKYAVDNSFF